MMKKKIIVLGLLIGCLLMTGCGKEQGKITGNYTNDDLSKMVDTIYKEVGEDNLPKTSITEVDINDLDSLKYYTGLTSNKDIDSVVASEAMIISQAYSFVLVKVKNDADITSVKQDIYDNIDTRKWICVEAEALYINNYDTVIAVVMTSKEWAFPLYDAFAKLYKDNLGTKLAKEMEI